MQMPDARRDRNDELRQRMRIEVKAIVRHLGRLAEAVRSVRGDPSAPQDPVSLGALAEGVERALGHARRAAAALEEELEDAGTSPAPVEVEKLGEELRDAFATVRIGGDRRSGPGGLRSGSLRRVTTSLRNIVAAGDRLLICTRIAQADRSDEPGARG